MPGDDIVIPDISDEQAEEVAESLPDIIEQVRAGQKPDLPGFELNTPTVVPPELLELLRNRETETPCGGAYTIEWSNGPWKGMPLNLYCQEPFCLNTPERECTGPRFVPGFKQYTKLDSDDPLYRERQVSIDEILAGVELAGKRAASITGVSDHRSKKEQARHVGLTWAALKESMRGKGNWGL